MDRRTFVATLPALVLATSCDSTPPPAKFKQKMVILGFDGMDPRLVEQWMKEGKLPNFQKLASKGGFYRLQTSTSPESPVSWASFAVGGNAGKHNIFDFLVRDVKTYVPDLGMVRREMPGFFLNYVPLGEPEDHEPARRHVVLGHRRARPACGRPC